jgi:hypothetical protein
MSEDRDERDSTEEQLAALRKEFAEAGLTEQVAQIAAGFRDKARREGHPRAAEIEQWADEGVVTTCPLLMLNTLIPSPQDWNQVIAQARDAEHFLDLLCQYARNRQN